MTEVQRGEPGLKDELKYGEEEVLRKQTNEKFIKVKFTYTKLTILT